MAVTEGGSASVATSERCEVNIEDCGQGIGGLGCELGLGGLGWELVTGG